MKSSVSESALTMIPLLFLADYGNHSEFPALEPFSDDVYIQSVDIEEVHERVDVPIFDHFVFQRDAAFSPFLGRCLSSLYAA